MRTKPDEQLLPVGSDAWFRNIVKMVRPEHVDVPGRCPDRYAGLISSLAGKADWSYAAQGNSGTRPPQACVLLVMESPHLEEYSTKYPYAPWPANGPTGRHVRQHIASAKLPTGSEAGLVLINAVPFQCSLGQRPIGPDRDTIFRLAWNSGGREFFQRRLLHWYREGDVVVNACTAGRDRDQPLREEVEEAIEAAVPNALRFRRYHPFRWLTPAMASASWQLKATIAR